MTAGAQQSSKLREEDWKYPLSPCRASGWMTTQDMPALATPHKLHWVEYGNPNGEPVLFVHGGPGGSCTNDPELVRFFDPERYRIIFFDQRGCGKSEPTVFSDACAALTNNTTQHLITDMLQLRRERGIHGKMHVFGGSWGSTLALAYAMAHPETVQTLILRGIFLCRQKDLDYFYQGNAATLAQNPHDTTCGGTYTFFPEAWENFVNVIEPARRGDMVKAYADIFAMRPQTDAEKKKQLSAALAWATWEGAALYLSQDLTTIDGFADPAFAVSFAQIENHYFMNGAFLGGGSGEEHRGNNYLLENIATIKNIPVHIVHGRYDVVCPLFQAEELVAALRQAGAQHIDYRITAAGHAGKDRENALALMDIMESLPPMTTNHVSEQAI